MHTELLKFIETLRHHDVPVSTAESLDAMRVLALVGYHNRSRVYDALSLTLAKTAEEKTIFDYCFRLFYHNGQEEAVAEESAPEGHAEEISADWVATDPAVNAALEVPLIELMSNPNPLAMDLAIARAAEQVNVRNMRFITQLGQYTRRTMQAAGVQQLEDADRELKAMRGADSHRATKLLAKLREQLRLSARDYVAGQFLLTGNYEGRKLQERSLQATRLSALEQRNVGEIRALVRKLAKKLAAKHSRRQRKTLRGKLDVGKTLRKNMRFDSVLLEIHCRKKRQDRSKVFAICDVSSSVSAYAKFLLLFLYSLQDVLPAVRSFVFSSRLGEVSELFQQHDLELAIELAFKQWGQGGSDYGQSLVDFTECCLGDIDRNSTVLIVGDARNNNCDPQLDQLRAIYHKAKRVIWLNPEQRSTWDTGDSEMKRYRTACHFVAECHTLDQLSQIIDQLLKSTR